MDKKELRESILSKRNSLDESLRFEADEKVALRLLALKEYRDANTIFCFVSYKSEIDTKNIIVESLRRGKRVIVPIVDKASKTMILSELRSMEELAPSDMGILEPKPEFVREVNPKVVDICITPGAVFDKHGYRIGYGGGFYDKMLPLFREDEINIGICYDIQVVDEVPIEEFDKPVDVLITPTDILRF